MITPHVYCLTIPYSERHIRMQKQLASCQCNFEFVFGTQDVDPAFEDAIRTPYTKRMIRKNMELDTKWVDGLRYTYCCREGMLRMMRKVAEDGLQWPLVLQDDVLLVDGWVEKYNEILKHLQPGMERVAVVRRKPEKDQGTPFMSIGGSFCNEVAMLCTPAFAKRYVRDVEKYPVESDVAVIEATGSRCLFSTTPLACLVCSPSTIATYD